MATALPARWEGRTSGLGVGGGAWEGLLGGGEDRAQPKLRQGSWGGGGGALRALTGTGGGALTGQGLLQETTFVELFSGALQENPVIALGQLH